MHFNDSKEKAARISEQVLRELSERGIPADPLNYYLWYEYHCGEHRKLIVTMDAIIEKQQRFTPELAQRLYGLIDGNTDEAALAEASGEAQEIIDGASTEINSACNEAMRYHQELDLNSKNLVESLDANELRRVVTTLVNETKDMMQNSQRMAERLNTLSSELTTVRTQFDQVSREASTDALTGLPNRKTFDHHLNSSMATALESGTPLCLIMADIDHFKAFNDNYGHVVGDKVLRYVGQTLQNILKGRDFVARYGGEEFAIILENTTMSGANSVAEEIRRTVAAAQLKMKSSAETLGTITMSLGIAPFRHGDAEEALIARADEALYRAKSAGRNRVESARAA